MKHFARSLRRVAGFLLLASSAYAQQTGAMLGITTQTFTGFNQFTKGVELGPIVFASLGSIPTLTTMIFVTDGTQGSAPCTGSGTGALAVRINGAWNCSLGAAALGGTVSSVALTLPTGMSVGGSPVTTTGTLAGTWNVIGADYALTSTGANAAAWGQVNGGASCGDATHAVSYSTSTHRCQTISAGGSGTVTSVALSLPTGMSVGGSPVTTTGTLAGTWNVTGADYALTSSAANTAAWGQINGGSSCGDSTHAVSYSTSTHLFGCQTIASGTGISGATNNGAMYATAATTGTSTGALTDGQVLIGSSAGAPAAATITAGSGVTVTNGHNTITVAAASGALVQLESHTASTSATLDFTTCLSGSYQAYRFQLRNLLPSSGSNTIALRVSTNGGSSYDATNGNYLGGDHHVGFNSLAGDGTQYFSTTELLIGVQNQQTSGTTGDGTSGWLDLYNTNSTSADKEFVWQTFASSSSTNSTYSAFGGGWYINNAASAVNAVRFLFASGNINAGTIVCYGVTP
ncbi:MAG TPA: hypothetical protein VK812_13270 [Candidatus Binatus sp.]|nr:hypothetical protein [Candidatus Binatus sp.]